MYSIKIKANGKTFKELKIYTLSEAVKKVKLENRLLQNEKNFIIECGSRSTLCNRNGKFFKGANTPNPNRRKFFYSN